MDYIEYYLKEEFCVGNTPSFQAKIPECLQGNKMVVKVLEYNDSKHGVIDWNFFEWALEKGISSEVVKWFLNDFSGAIIDGLDQFIDARFTQYTFYLDESNNPLKFRFKDKDGNTNKMWYEDFVLAGVVFSGLEEPFDIDELFGSLMLQNNIKDVKLKHLVSSSFKGNNSKRFLEILKSNKIEIVFNTLLNVKDVFIHWSTLNLLYYALVDIVDEMCDTVIWNESIKNTLFDIALRNRGSFLSLLTKYDYPNIKEEEARDFCEELLNWIDSLTDVIPEEEMGLDFLRAGVKQHVRDSNLILLRNNQDNTLIESFSPLYANRLGAFPSSKFHFDQIDEVEKEIGNYVSINCPIKQPEFDFNNSEDNKWIQLSDIIAGLFGAYMAYINVCDEKQIALDLEQLSGAQKNRLKSFLLLIEKSSRHNMYFDHMSANYREIEHIHFLNEMVFSE